jgi:2-dehydropantoate 2-reductase
MRYIIYGAGAIGGVIGGQLAQAGQDVVLIARGPHLDALRAQGLRLVTPDGDLQPPVRAVASPAEIGFQPGDTVLLTMKSQDTQAAVRELDAVAPPDVNVICAQNGVNNERVVLRRRARTFGMCLVLPATHLEPGVAIVHAAPVSGILDVGRYPGGLDDTSERVAADLRAATFDARADAQVMRWKYAKLLGNLGNALDAACGLEGRQSHLYARARAEGEACCAAAGIEYATPEEEEEHRAALIGAQTAGQGTHRGSSSWQSLARGTGSIEADWLNGEMVLLGRLHGLPTPVNEVLCQVANRMARDRLPPGSWSMDRIDDDVRRLEARSASSH